MHNQLAECNAMQLKSNVKTIDIYVNDQAV